MKQIHINRIIQCVEKLCMDSNYYLNCDIYNAIEASIKDETSENGRMVLDILLKNADIAKKKRLLFARIQVWLLCFYKWDRTYISLAEA